MTIRAKAGLFAITISVLLWAVIGWSAAILLF